MDGLSPLNKKTIRFKTKGFSLIEIMVVVAIIAILTSIALPVYENYVARSQVAEGFLLTSEAKNSVTSFYFHHGYFPASNASAQLASPTSITGRYVSSVDVGNVPGQIKVIFGHQALNALQGKALILQAQAQKEDMSWSCPVSIQTVPVSMLPAVCQR